MIDGLSRLGAFFGVPTFLVRGDVYFWGSMIGAGLIASVPIAIIYNAFVAGFTVGAVK